MEDPGRSRLSTYESRFWAKYCAKFHRQSLKSPVSSTSSAKALLKSSVPQLSDISRLRRLSRIRSAGLVALMALDG